MRRPWLTIALGWTVLGLGCGDLGTGPRIWPTQLVSDSLTVVAKTSPRELAAGDSLQVIAVYHNRLDRPLNLGFGMGCDFFLETRDRDSGSPTPFDGTLYGCTLMGHARTIPPGDSATAAMWIRASIGGYPVSRGRYVVRLDFTNSLQELEAAIFVR